MKRKPNDGASSFVGVSVGSSFVGVSVGSPCRCHRVPRFSVLPQYFDCGDCNFSASLSLFHLLPTAYWSISLPTTQLLIVIQFLPYQVFRHGHVVVLKLWFYDVLDIFAPLLLFRFFLGVADSSLDSGVLESIYIVFVPHRHSLAAGFCCFLYFGPFCPYLLLLFLTAGCPWNLDFAPNKDNDSSSSSSSDDPIKKKGSKNGKLKVAIFTDAGL
ncbi:unnamed protein product [Lactuca saligna]|uniref:Uncharacterized protein n=1 Tax=Lactuca saligna TaxID=75948 RepID=A0AA35YDQ3_LACSI|nr:unnamed protein product [Lactuca saligna]